jgi:hypothetical protein
MDLHRIPILEITPNLITTSRLLVKAKDNNLTNSIPLQVLGELWKIIPLITVTKATEEGETSRVIRAEADMAKVDMTPTTINPLQVEETSHPFHITVEGQVLVEAITSITTMRRLNTNLKRGMLLGDLSTTTVITTVILNNSLSSSQITKETINSNINKVIMLETEVVTTNSNGEEEVETKVTASPHIIMKMR